MVLLHPRRGLAALRSEQASDKGEQFLQRREMCRASRHHVLDTAYEVSHLYIGFIAKLHDKGP
jgi:hypothetical protein